MIKFICITYILYARNKNSKLYKKESVFITVPNDLPVYSDISDEDKIFFQKFYDNPYSPVGDISLIFLQETIGRLQSLNEEHMNKEDTLHLEEEKEVMIQEDFEEQVESSSDVSDTDKVRTRKLMHNFNNIPAHLWGLSSIVRKRN